MRSGPRAAAAVIRGVLCSAATVVALLASPNVASAKVLTFAETVMTGLANPRGMTFGSDGTLYVAEAGTGGGGPTILSGDGVTTLGYGLSAAISQLTSGVQSRLVSGLPSLAEQPGGFAAHGPQNLAFGQDGRLYVTMGLGADPAELLKLAGQPGAALVGSVAVIDAGVAQVFADIAGFEATVDPNDDGPDSNAYGIVAVGDGFVVTDAGGNSVLRVDVNGVVSTVATIPNATTPLPNFGVPDYDAVPTGIAAGPAGIFFGQLTGFPFPPGLAQIFSLGAAGATAIASGLTNVIDVAFGPDGTLYALELDSDSLFGLIGPATTGSIWSIGLDGTTRLLIDSLENPTGMTIGSGGSFFVSVNGFTPADGAVVRLELAPIPLPAALPALAGGLALLAAFGAIRRRR